MFSLQNLEPNYRLYLNLALIQYIIKSELCTFARSIKNIFPSICRSAPGTLAVPEEVVVDGQKEAHVERILARRVRSVRGKEVEEWKVRWTGYSKAHDQWRTRDKLERGSPLQQLREFEQARLHMEAQVRDEATGTRRQLCNHFICDCHAQ